MWADPTVPDRSLAITGDGAALTSHLAIGAKRLAESGVDFYIVACSGAHVFMPRVRETVNLDYLSMVGVTTEDVTPLSHAKGAELLTTDTALESDLYQ